MKYPSYPKYKPSGACLPSCCSSSDRQVEWLGEVPGHWAESMALAPYRHSRAGGNPDEHIRH